MSDFTATLNVFPFAAFVAAYEDSEPQADPNNAFAADLARKFRTTTDRQAAAPNVTREQLAPLDRRFAGGTLLRRTR